MHKFSILAAMLFACIQLNAQYKNDNVLYKTVYPEDLAQQLKASGGYLLLDVRSKGENEDTSSFGLNIGRLKNARNIDVRQLGTRLNELQQYKDQPVFVYCSHSQRSRRASKMLADSGFTKVYNINGGMTTLIQSNYGLNDIYETKDNYQLLSPVELCKDINNKNVYLLDVRDDSGYNGISTNETINAMGKLKNTAHIPFATLENSVSQIPTNKKIIIVDEYGNESIKAATLLTSKGYKNVAVLFDGLFNFMTNNAAELVCKNAVWANSKQYHIVTADEFNDMAKQNKDAVIIDTRTVAEYNNQAKDSWRNMGHIKNAINIPYSEFDNRLNELTAYKTKPIIVYHFNSTDSYNAAAKLVASGFTNVNVLAGGIFNLRWRAANIKNKAALKDWVVDVPAENL
ncbi:MAG TPA: rhodanese-like domain-containing protein [Chitinophagaceae bacterium]|nr:rhodanese-like domain-containing protein [Chitinophagaceae bacterium]